MKDERQIKKDTQALEDLATSLRAERIAKDITAADLARIVFNNGNHGHRITNFEHGKRGWTVKTLIQVLNALNLRILIVSKEK